MFETILEASIRGCFRTSLNAFNDFKDLNDLNSSDFRRLSPVFIIPKFHYSFLLVTLSVKHPWYHTLKTE
jgi:hypothetical protein